MKDGLTMLLENFIANLASQFGFQNIQRPCLNMLINLYLSFFESIASKSLTYAEAANRSKVVLNDIVMALIDFGLDVNRLLGPVRPNISGSLNEPPSRCIQSRGITTESVLGMNGTRVVCVQPSLRSEIVKPVVPAASSSISSTNVPTPPKAPAHLFVPPLPDPHTYLFTKVTRPLPANNMAGLRRLKLEKRRKTQVSLMHYVALRQEPHYLFPPPAEGLSAIERMEFATCSMILLPSTSSRPYISALMTEETNDNDCNSEKEDQKIEVKRPKFSEQDGTLSDNAGTNFFLSKPIFPVEVSFNTFV
ncbi:unnamed protein product [Rodentolepis nana]|uniref:Transcription initiation factor TFIID subunit 8 n=1 Tax=Rodentolepis nana TaxID=102285 RepID=A0A158QHE3_RODNA|nr:unnamed protein product [Rodentolepis nana]